jgi:hypothetical protein
MSMIGCFRRVSARDLGRLQADPDLMTNLLIADDEKPAGFDPFEAMDVDKAWHGIHYLLAGKAWEGEPPLDFIVAGGQEIAEDLGYGPPRCFTVDEVRAIARALAPITPGILESRYDAKAMSKQEIYPDIWTREGKEAFSYLASYFEELKGFILGAAEQGEALIVYLS